MTTYYEYDPVTFYFTGNTYEYQEINTTDKVPQSYTRFGHTTALTNCLWIGSLQQWLTPVIFGTYDPVTKQGISAYDVPFISISALDQTKVLPNSGTTGQGIMKGYETSPDSDWDLTTLYFSATTNRWYQPTTVYLFNPVTKLALNQTAQGTTINIPNSSYKPYPTTLISPWASIEQYTLVPATQAYGQDTWFNPGPWWLYDENYFFTQFYGLPYPYTGTLPSGGVQVPPAPTPQAPPAGHNWRWNPNQGSWVLTSTAGILPEQQSRLDAIANIQAPLLSGQTSGLNWSESALEQHGLIGIHADMQAFVSSAIVGPFLQKIMDVYGLSSGSDAYAKAQDLYGAEIAQLTNNVILARKYRDQTLASTTLAELPTEAQIVAIGGTFQV